MVNQTQVPRALKAGGWPRLGLSFCAYTIVMTLMFWWAGS